MYSLKFHLQTKKQIRQLHPKDQKKFFKAISLLAKNPFSKNPDLKKLVGTRSSWRLRIGDFRVICSLEKERKSIYVWEIGYRGGIY